MCSYKKYGYYDPSFDDKFIVYTDQNGAQFIYVFDIMDNQVISGLVTYFIDNTLYYKTLRKMEYDSNNNKTKETNSLGHSTRFEYDSANRLIGKYFWEDDEIKKKSMTLDYTVGHDVSTAQYLELTDEEGYKTRYYYDKLNRLYKTEKSMDKITFHSIVHEYDYVGNKISTTNERDKKT